MKKIITLLMALVMMVAFTGCGDNSSDKKGLYNSASTESAEPTEMPELTDEPVDDVNNKEETAEKPQTPTTTTPEENQPQITPETPGQQEEKPSETPSDTPLQNASLGQILLSDFKGKAASGMSTLEIAEGLMMNEAILFAGGAMEVEEGFLSGFDNTEIKGFESAAVFMPMIGSIAFVGYIFELPDGADVPAFIQTLRDSANLRWNICVAADEMVTGSVGNKVFFVMCPTSLGE